MTMAMEKFLNDRVKTIVAEKGNTVATWWYIAKLYGEVGIDCLLENYSQPSD